MDIQLNLNLKVTLSIRPDKKEFMADTIAEIMRYAEENPVKFLSEQHNTMLQRYVIWTIEPDRIKGYEEIKHE